MLETRWGLFFSLVAIVIAARFALCAGPRAMAGAPENNAAWLPIAPASGWRSALNKWFTPFALGFMTLYPVVVICMTGFGPAR